MSKSEIAVAAVTAVTLLLVVVPAVYGVQPDSAGVLYATYLDWLQGKPVGLAQVNPVLPHSVEKATLVVIDYTSGQPKVLYKGPFMSPLVKIKRIPVGTELKTVVEDGKVRRITVTKYKPVQLYVIVSGRGYWGAKFIEFTPEKPLTHVNVRVPLYRDGVKESVKNFGKGFQVTDTTVGYREELVKIFRLHSVPGVTEKLILNAGKTNVFLDSFSKSSSDFGSTNWKRSGPESTVLNIAAAAPTSNGEMKVVYGQVRFRLDKYTVCGYLICRTVYHLHPVAVVGMPKVETLADPGVIPSNLEKITYPKSLGNSFTISFGRSSDDKGVYLSTAVSLCFGGEFMSICFTGNVNTYRESTNPPKIGVIIDQWHGSRLYYAPYSSRGNYYEVYLQWG